MEGGGFGSAGFQAMGGREKPGSREGAAIGAYEVWITPRHGVSRFHLPPATTLGIAPAHATLCHHRRTHRLINT